MIHTLLQKALFQSIPKFLDFLIKLYISLINNFLVLYFLNFFTLCDIMMMSIGKVFQEKKF